MKCNRSELNRRDVISEVSSRRLDRPDLYKKEKVVKLVLRLNNSTAEKRMLDKPRKRKRTER